MAGAPESLAVATQSVNSPWLPRLIAITDAERFGIRATLEAALRVCMRAPSRSVVIQLREAALSFEQALELGRELSLICEANGQGLCVNDRLDLALALGTPRFHRKPSSPSPEQVRSELGGVGTPWLTQGWHPADEPPPVSVDAVVVSPAIAARKGRAALGLSAFTSAVRAIEPVPTYALGGVSAEAVAGLFATGAVGVAVQEAWYSDPEALLAALDRAANGA